MYEMVNLRVFASFKSFQNVLKHWYVDGKNISVKKNSLFYFPEDDTKSGE